MNVRMKLAAAIVAVLAGPAGAADLPSYKAPLPPPPLESPFIFYFGGFIGGGIGPSTPGFSGKSQYAGDVTSSPCAFAENCASLTNTDRSSGRNGFLNAGVKAGFDMPIGHRAIFGAMIDFSGAAGKSHVSRRAFVPGVPLISLDEENTLNSSLTANWLATARLRFGIKLSERLLAYASGGLALVNVKASTSTYYGASCIAGVCTQEAGQFGSKSSTLPGFAIGAGLEYAWALNWTIGLDYFYYRAAGSYTVAQNMANGILLNPDSFRVKTIAEGHILRLGLNYRF